MTDDGASRSQVRHRHLQVTKRWVFARPARAQDVVDIVFAEPEQVLRLGERRLGDLHLGGMD